MEEPAFSVLLTGAGSRRADVVQAVRSVTGESAFRSGLLVDAVPVVVVERTWFEAAEDAAARLAGLGAEVALRCGWCERTLSPGAGVVDPAPCASPHWPAESCPAADRPGS